ncbi:MAG: protein-L-isoaspartate(D-aspartate) O-methyltransferase [Candidatus Helarchaeota archaeon]
MEEKKKKLLDRYLHSKTAISKNVIRAYNAVPRENFLPENQTENAYNDTPLSIGHNQTISAPHISFIYAEKLDMKEGLKVLEIGGGSGYNAAFFAELVAPKGSKNPGHVYTIERIPELAEFAKRNLEKNGYKDRVTVIIGDGTCGYEKEAPYDRIIVTAAGPEIPKPLTKQLGVGGILIMPVGKKHSYQELILLKKTESEIKKKNLGGVAFVPLIGKYGF